MPRDVRAYLADAIDACDAIVAAVEGFDFQSYQDTRLVRSSVWIEIWISPGFWIEAGSWSMLDERLKDRIGQYARRIYSPSSRITFPRATLSNTS